ncbi:hypothetical protein [Cognatiyoonia sp.]|uniref:hypothetical protein n=1 Tax=Cognatiyoonia sp. TaxID=2211652 RepID=UPI003F6A1003
MADIIETARAFHAELKANNTKAWWNENRGTYNKELLPNFATELPNLRNNPSPSADC